MGKEAPFLLVMNRNNWPSTCKEETAIKERASRNYKGEGGPSILVDNRFACDTPDTQLTFMDGNTR